MNVLDKYGDYDLYSFDIFDTTISRIVGSPQGIFSIIRDRLLHDGDYKLVPTSLKNNFISIRINAEDILRKNVDNKNQEIILKEIYDKIAYDYFLSSEIEDKLISLEIETEIFCSIPLCETVNDINNLLNLGKKVCFISDMYLPQSVIRKMLNKADNRLNTLRLYVSSDYRKTKSNGDLFEIVANEYNINRGKWLHVGDNKYSDKIVPSRRGINTKLVSIIENSNLEKFLLENFSNISYLQVLVGCSKLSLQYKKNNFMYLVGSRYIAPVFVLYVEWILEQSLKRNITDLYFIARDGYILKIIADKLIKSRRINVKTHYIYGSRVAWNPSLKGELFNSENIIRYINQEIECFCNIAFVDVFGSGKTLDNLMEVINKKEEVVNVFYFKSFSAKLFNINKYEYCFAVDVWSRIELFCKAPEGPCIGYENISNLMVPICDKEAGNSIVKFNFSDYILGIEKFMDYYCLCEDIKLLSVYSDYDLLYYYLNYMQLLPDNHLRRYMIYFPKDSSDREFLSNIFLYRYIKNIGRKIKKIRGFVKILKEKKVFYLLK